MFPDSFFLPFEYCIYHTIFHTRLKSLITNFILYFEEILIFFLDLDFTPKIIMKTA